MPTFDFACSACGNIFEKKLPFGDKTKPACPACTSKKTERQISPPRIVFKGPGFYKTDSGPKPIKAEPAPAPVKEAVKEPPKPQGEAKKESSKPMEK